MNPNQNYNPHARPAMMAPRRRILRIGVLLGGKIVEERLVRERSPVSIGQSAKNTFSIPLENLPREFVLFALEGDQYKLQFGPKMDGRVSDGAQVYTFDQVKGTKAVQHGDHWTMPLSDQARGKVSMGDLTLLFQFVTEPPIQPKPMLPASVRGTFADRIDPRLAVCESVSIVLCFAIMLAAWLHEGTGGGRKQWGARQASIPPELTEQTIEMTPPETPPDPGAGSQAEKPKEPDKTPAKTPTKTPSGDHTPSKPAPSGRSEEDATHLQEEAARYAAALASEGESTDGVDGKMGKTAPGGDLDQQIKETRDSGANVKVGGAGDRGTRGNGDPRAGTGHGPDVHGPQGPDTSGTANKEEKVPKGRIQVSSKKSLDDTSLSADAVIGRIQSVFMAGLQRCYKNLLKTDPTAHARVVLSFTVNASGRVTEPQAQADSADLSSCIEGQMKSWTFPPPKDASDGSATSAAFQVALALQPG